MKRIREFLRGLPSHFRGLNVKQIVLLSASVLYLGAEITLGTLLHLASGRLVAVLSYACIIINALFALVLCTGRLPSTLTAVGLMFTLFADYCLVYSESIMMLPAMCFFNVTQLAYAARLFFDDENRLRQRIHLILRISLMLLGVLLPLIILGDGADTLSVLSVVYFLNLLLNTGMAFANFRSSPTLALGLLLFVGCDVFVGLGNLDIYFDIPRDSVLYSVLYPGINMAWVFYVPSQMLLTLSLLPARLRSLAEKRS